MSRLPAAHFGTGSAVGTCGSPDRRRARHRGAALRAAAGAADLETFRTGWGLVMTATALLTAGCGLAVGRTRTAVPTPVPAAPLERA